MKNVGETIYDEKDYIEIAPDDAPFGRWEHYKYRVLNKTKTMPSHHTNSLHDAQSWFNKCRQEWLEQDQRENLVIDK